jgi:hypothetical protein
MYGISCTPYIWFWLTLHAVDDQGQVNVRCMRRGNVGLNVKGVRRGNVGLNVKCVRRGSVGVWACCDR